MPGDLTLNLASLPPAFEERFEIFTSFDGYEGVVQWPRIERNSTFAVLPSLLTSDEVRTLRDALPESMPFEQHEDSVDGEVTHEFWVWDKGGPDSGKRGPDLGEAARRQHKDAKKGLAPMVADILKRFADVVSARYGSELCGSAGCVPCSSLIRRYLPHERRSHPMHFDMEALATVVVSLSDDYEGGLYVHTGGKAPPQYLTLAPGAAVVHSSDLLHGVRVTSGSRWSWVTWFSDGGRSDDPEDAPSRAPEQQCSPQRYALWDMEAAKAGDPVRQLLHYFRLPPGAPGRVDWLRASAKAGFAVCKAYH